MNVSSPYFSLIMPVYNRATTIGRAIESCLSQQFKEFELLIVDDASTDDSLSRASAYHDSRLRVFTHSTNRGPCPSRNTAIAHAAGAWCVMLDSDDELMPDALENLFNRTSKASRDIGNVASRCVRDTGEITPQPFIPDRPMDFQGYLKWSLSLTVSDYLNCIRREVFDDLSYPDNRAWEAAFHLDLAAHWKIDLTREINARVHTDAPNRVSAASADEAINSFLRDAPDKLSSFEKMLAKHGSAILDSVPEYYFQTLLRAGHQAFLSDNLRNGVSHVWRAFVMRPFSPPLWGLFLIGLLGGKATAFATRFYRRHRANFPS